MTMFMKTARLLLLTGLIVFAVTLSGCGSAGGGNVLQVSQTALTPNYLSSLQNENHYPSLPMKVYYELPGNWSGMFPANVTTDAALNWNQPGRQAFFQVVNTSQGADVRVDFAATPDPAWGQDAIGVCEYKYSKSTHVIQEGSVVIHCSIASINGHIFGAQTMQGTIAHELGHALGIDGHSPTAGDLMYFQSQPGVFLPQMADVNTALSLYPNYFGNKLTAPQQGMPSITPTDWVYHVNN